MLSTELADFSAYYCLNWKCKNLRLKEHFLNQLQFTLELPVMFELVCLLLKLILLVKLFFSSFHSTLSMIITSIPALIVLIPCQMLTKYLIRWLWSAFRNALKMFVECSSLHSTNIYNAFPNCILQTSSKAFPRTMTMTNTVSVQTLDALGIGMKFKGDFDEMLLEYVFHYLLCFTWWL